MENFDNICVTEFLDLKKVFIGNEQQKLEMEEQYLLLHQSYQDLQIQSQEQQAKLVENLEKSYDAYNEKFMKVEELEKQLDQCNKNLQEIYQQNKNKVLFLYQLKPNADSQTTLLCCLSISNLILLFKLIQILSCDIHVVMHELQCYLWKFGNLVYN